MGKRSPLILFLIAALLSLTCYGQGGTWTWMHGSYTVNSTGDYGTKGVAAATNEPPARYQACFWTDRQGNFWMFGGVINTVQGNDLWKYDVSTDMWTWISGPNVITSQNPFGVYGTKGVPSANNYPSGRGYGANCWTDNNGDLWLYGGAGGFNDLWKYNIATNQWTWVNGNQYPTGPVYGTKGVASAMNTPGSLQEAKSAWVDAANNLWMFGGVTSSYSNALWKYTISSDTWTWVNGSTGFTSGNYGTYRVESSSNQPPPRFSYTRWKNASGNMYLFAGKADSCYNDVWRYRPSTNKWTWISGSNLINSAGSYPPQKCTFYDNYFPPSRFENQTAFSINSCAKAFWTFGGWDGSLNFLNDLWLFNTDSLKWNWVSGSNQKNVTGSYGIKGVRKATNVPPGKAGQCMWTDSKNNLWLFGGYVTGMMRSNDLWRFEPDILCIDKSALFGAVSPPKDTLLCPGDTTEFIVGGHQSVSYSPAAFVTPDADSSLLKFSPPVTTAYVVVIKGGQCAVIDDTIRFTVRVNQRDAIKLSPPGPLAICPGDSVRMKVKSEWTIAVTPNTDVRFLSSGDSEIVFYPNTTTSYLVYAGFNDKCGGTADSIRFTITTDTTGATHLGPMTDTILCKGDTAVYQMDAKRDRFFLAPPDYFSVSNDSTTIKFYPPATTRYQLTGIKSIACKKIRDTLNFTIHRSAIKTSFNVTPKETDQNHPVFQLTNTTINSAQQYSWYRNNSFWTNETSPMVTVSDTGLYCFTLVASDVYHCLDSSTDCGRVIHAHIYVPSAFSPNGDGKNDFFKAFTNNVKILELSVFNRFGQRVFVAYSNDQSWNGTYHGIPCDLGTYFYQIKYRILDQEPVLIKGDVTLVR